MIVQFPSFYPDKLVYSLLARYYVKSGYMRYTFAAQDLFASKTVRPNIEFVNQYTSAVCEILTKNLPIEYIIEKHTMFPFYGRFIKQDKKQKAFESLCNMDIESEVTIGAYLHSKMLVNKYRSVRGEQRNMADSEGIHRPKSKF